MHLQSQAIKKGIHASQHVSLHVPWISYIQIQLVSSRPRSDTKSQYIGKLQPSFPLFQPIRGLGLPAETHGTARVSHMAFPTALQAVNRDPHGPLTTARASRYCYLYLSFLTCLPPLSLSLPFPLPPSSASLLLLPIPS